MCLNSQKKKKWCSNEVLEKTIMKRVPTFQLKIRKNGALVNGQTKKLIMAGPARSEHA